MGKKKNRPKPEPLGPPQGETWKDWEITIEHVESRVEIILPGGGFVTVYSNGYVERNL